MIRWVALVLWLGLTMLPAAHAEVLPDRLAHLARGVNVTNWFRFPASKDPVAIRAYLGDRALLQLRQRGFTAIRLPVQPEYLRSNSSRLKLLVQAITRIESHGLAVAVVADPATWNLESSESDRVSLFAFWGMVAPALRELDPDLTFPELMNEPVFPGMVETWRNLQHRLLEQVRTTLPDHTIILTGNDWGSVSGLLALRPESDPNVIYTLHFYEPMELTSLAAYRPQLDHMSLARLPFPADQRAACFKVAATASDDATASLMRFYCGLGWNSARVASRIAAAATWGRRHHVSILLGEFGAATMLNPDARLAWLRSVREACEARGIGWLLWGYDDVMGFGLGRPPPVRPLLDPALLRALGLSTSM